MKTFIIRLLAGFVGAIVALLTVHVCSIFLNDDPDNIVGWVALGIASSMILTKAERY